MNRLVIQPEQYIDPRTRLKVKIMLNIKYANEYRRDSAKHNNACGI